MRVERQEVVLRPLPGAGGPGEDDGPELLVAVAEDVARDEDAVAGRALRRMGAAVDDGLRVLEVDPRKKGAASASRRGVSASAQVKRRDVGMPLRWAAVLPRSAGVELHPTSLPGGRLGRQPYAWVDWLAEAGQTWWQMLPLGPPDR